MARMSIDDKMLRDPRAILLARKFGWRRQEAVGRLLDVYSVAYDRERDVIRNTDIDIAAEQEGFADAMIEVDLAETVRAGVRIKGAKERIAYLSRKSKAGRIGGLNSAESRRNVLKQTVKQTSSSGGSTASSAWQAAGNPPDPVPDPPSASVPDDLPDPVPEDLREPPPPAPESSAPLPPKRSNPRKAPKVVMQTGWTPRPEERVKAESMGLAVADLAEHFRDHHTAKGSVFADWDAAFRTWIGNAQRFANGSQNGRGPARSQPLQHLLDDIARREAAGET